MKDMMGIELEVDQYVFYFHAVSGGTMHEEAKIILVGKKSIRVEFLGNRSYGKNRGDQSNIFNTSGRIFILNKNIEKERLAHYDEIHRMADQIEELIIENDELRVEVEKIHNRFEILDF